MEDISRTSIRERPPTGTAISTSRSDKAGDEEEEEEEVRLKRLNFGAGRGRAQTLFATKVGKARQRDRVVPRRRG